ncbi:SRPBCC family protein [Geodermatophilus sp. YIM 151500]|uniref:SRPBCC family protein n=1 Tax=Geodermatophilus sp. YIM 151500 TaxID=2984531 RepID=UPI0021E3EEE1|nr:SRPBCC family protein [Geodermatophilus sp. YIM 151500]MCV2489379.1 SRPBCC family protein [Geodermatophilus sp. YIM 151500]
MPELTLSMDVEVPPEQVFAALADWSRQGEWMLLTDVAPVGGAAHGVGGQVRAVTGLPVGGRRRGVLDTFVITAWDPPRRIDVRHTGKVVRGTGTFEVVPKLAGSTFVWSEQLDLPLGALGRLGWPMVRPLFAFGVWLSLSRFRDFARHYAG